MKTIEKTSHQKEKRHLQTLTQKQMSMVFGGYKYTDSDGYKHTKDKNGDDVSEDFKH